MKVFKFDTQVLYSQVVLFNQDIEYPFSDWTDAHVNQGFVWREGAISFGTLTESVDSTINFIYLTQKDYHLKWSENSKIRISLPFKVTDIIEFGSLFDTVEVELPKGLYQVYFEACEVEHKEVYNIILVENQYPFAKVHLLEDGQNPPLKLLMSGEPAI